MALQALHQDFRLSASQPCTGLAPKVSLKGYFWFRRKFSTKSPLRTKSRIRKGGGLRKEGSK